MKLLELALLSKNSDIIDSFLQNLSLEECIYNLDFSNGNNIGLLKLVLFSEHLRAIRFFMENNSFKECIKNLDFNNNEEELENYLKLFELILSSKSFGLIDTFLQNRSFQACISDTLEFPKDNNIFKQLLEFYDYTVYNLLAKNKSLINYTLNLKTKQENNSLNEEEKEMFDLISKENFLNRHLVKNKALTEDQKHKLKQISELMSQKETHEIEMIERCHCNIDKTPCSKEQKEELETRLDRNNGMIYNNTQQLNQLQGASNSFDSKIKTKIRNSLN